MLDGILAQAIAGSSATSFNNLTVSNTVAAVSVNTNANIAGTLNMNGAGSLLVPGATVIFNNAGAAGTISGNGTIRITRISATADQGSAPDPRDRKTNGIPTQTPTTKWNSTTASS